MIVEMLIGSCVVSGALNLYFLVKGLVQEEPEVLHPTVKVVIDSLESDTGWVFFPPKNNTVATYRNDPLGISFTLVACSELKELGGDVTGGGLVRPSRHVFTKHERGLVLAATQNLEVKTLSEKRSNLLDQQIKMLESGE
jgi:hypothetical protein